MVSIQEKRFINSHSKCWIEGQKLKNTVTGSNLQAFEGKWKCSCSMRIDPGYGAYVSAGDLDQEGREGITTGAGPGLQKDLWVRIFKGDGTSLGEGFFAYPDPVEYGVRPSGMNAK